MKKFMQLCLGYLACIVVCFTSRVHAQLRENSIAPGPAENAIFNVLNFGAKGDGEADDSKAFLGAFGQVCNATKGVMLVPSGHTFLLQTIEFNGRSCSPNFTVQLDGKIVAPQQSGWQHPDFQWILFSFFSNGLIIQGKGTIDGNGQSWWKTGGNRPNALKISDGEHVTLSGVTIQNSPLFHIFVDSCKQVTISGVKISSPQDSPNTDGIHLTRSQHVEISHCPIAVGDDCIAMLTGVSDVKIHNIQCGPGHGLSIGGLGKNKEQADVHDVSVYDSSVSDALSGVRIKTWQGGSGNVSNITFSNIQVNNVNFPIVIDQHYCGGEAPNCTAPGPMNIAISGVSYKGIRGTYRYKAVNLVCNQNQPCRNLEFADVNLTPVKGTSTSSDPYCSYAYGKVLTQTTPDLFKCLLPGPAVLKAKTRAVLHE